MSNSIHGHEVLKLLSMNRASWNRDRLKKEIDERFGPQATFHTCSSENMNASDLIDFLFRKGKITETNQMLSANEGEICGGE